MEQPQRHQQEAKKSAISVGTNTPISPKDPLKHAWDLKEYNN